MFEHKVLRRVTLPVLKLGVGVERYFKFTSPMRTGKQVSDTMAPAEIMDAVDLETGEIGVVIIPTVMQKELHEGYPKEAYVGRCFAVRLTRVPGKRYNHVYLAEIAEPPPLTAAQRDAALAQRSASAKQREEMPDPLADNDPELEDEPVDVEPPKRAPAKKAVAKKTAKRR